MTNNSDQGKAGDESRVAAEMSSSSKAMSGASAQKGGVKGTSVAKKPRKRRVLPLVLLVVLICAGGAFGYHWWTVMRFVESTDDAYVKADIATLSAEVPGEVVAVPVADNQVVAKGDVLVRLDDRDYQDAVDSAKANIASINAAIATIAANRALQMRTIDAAVASEASAKADMDFAQEDYERNRQLVKSNAVSVRTTNQSHTTLQTARAAWEKAHANTESARKQLDVLAAQLNEQKAALQSAEVSLRGAETNLGRTVVRAPRDGVVGNKGVRVGAYVSAGTQLVSVVPADDIYVVANFKETQIEHFRKGMPVTLKLDMLGGQKLRGKIDSIAPAAGAEFAVIPPQNATGNFTKIVQRVPVKILFDHVPDDVLMPRPGTSVVVRVNTRDVAEGDLR